jgi:lipopolysaccharide/colanic/teichoic acid biosynthesis glycosyltransferase
MWWAKRTFDLCTAILLTIVLAPVMTVICVAILVDSGTPILYRGSRTGHWGKSFKILKFRTMHPDAESMGGTTTGTNDPRVTRIGHILRRYKLDELPQLFNVIKGDMSLVGPRPEVQEYTDLYSDEERLILSVRPGITDYSSLHFIDLAAIVGEDADDGYRRDVLATKNRLRLKYVRERSFAGDFRIIMSTANALVRRMADGIRPSR